MKNIQQKQKQISGTNGDNYLLYSHDKIWQKKQNP